MSGNALTRGEMVVRVIAQTAVDNETYFCELDAVVGDGDFGYSLARGFEVVLSDWDAMEYSDVGGLLKKTAIILSKRIGGTSGPIWGTAFLRAGGALSDKPEPSGEEIIAAMRASIEGIKQRREHGSRRQDAARCARPRRRRARGGAPRGCGHRARAGGDDGAHERRGDDRAWSRCADARPTPATAARARSTRARLASRSCSRPSARPGRRPSWNWPDGRGGNRVGDAGAGRRQAA